MGYSISIKFKSESQKKDIVDFIKENKDIMNEIVATPFIGCVKLQHFDITQFFEDENIPYGPKGKNLIGWKERGIPHGLYAIVLWLSHKTEQNAYYYDAKKYHVVVTDKFDDNVKEGQVNYQGILFKQQIIPDNGFLQKMIEYLADEENKCEKVINNIGNLEKIWAEKYNDIGRPKKKM